MDAPVTEVSRPESREFEKQALLYVKTCTNPRDRAYILALAVALDNSHARVEQLARWAMSLGHDAEKICKSVGAR